jgi:hypothetical protein
MKHLFMGVTLVSILWPRFGGGLHVILALFAAWFFQAFTWRARWHLAFSKSKGKSRQPLG